MTPKSLAVSCGMGLRAFPAPPTYMGHSERKDKGRGKAMAVEGDEKRWEQARRGKEGKSLRIGGR